MSLKRRGAFLMSAALLTFLVVVTFAQERGEVEKRGGGYVERIEKTLDVERGGTLYLETPMGSIEVDAWNKDRVRVIVEKKYRGRSESEAREVFSEFEVYVDREGADVHVRVESPWDDFDDGMNVSFRMTVPEQYNLDVETRGGSIDIDDLEGNVAAETKGGSIRVGEITGGNVDVETSGGSIQIRGINKGSGRAVTAGGSITVGDVTGTLEAKTAGGSIHLDRIGETVIAKTAGGSIHIEEGGSDVSARTSGGSISVGEVGGDADVDTRGGSISVGPAKGDVSANTAGGSIHVRECGGSVSSVTAGGSIRVDGSNGPVVVKTAGGSIDIDDARGYIEAKTSGGSIAARLVTSEKGIDTHCTLESDGGGLTLYIPEDLQATFSAELKITRRARKDYEIECDFPLEIERTERKITARGDINGGGDMIRLRTVNGDIKIRKLSQ